MQQQERTVSRKVKQGRGGISCDLCPRLHWIERGEIVLSYSAPGIYLTACGRQDSNRLLKLAYRLKRAQEDWNEEYRRKFIPIISARRCSGCDVVEGELHELGCDRESCPFCDGQLFSCGCCYKAFYPSYNPKYDYQLGEPVVPLFGLPKAVYEEGLPDHLEKEWMLILRSKGRIPFIHYPLLCQRCGTLWPEFFRVSDEEWDHYIEPNMRRSIICWTCYSEIKELIDNGRNKTEF